MATGRSPCSGPFRLRPGLRRASLRCDGRNHDSAGRAHHRRGRAAFGRARSERAPDVEEAAALATLPPSHFKSPLIYILLFAVLFDVGVWFYDRFEGWPVEGFVIGGVLLLNALLGTFQEYQSEQALAQLAQLTTATVWAMRNGRLVQVPSRDLVPGDVVRLEVGERIPADVTLLDGRGVMADEAVLTGESVPVEKPLGAELASGTLLVRGKALAEVIRTGAASAMGEEFPR